MVANRISRGNRNSLYDNNRLRMGFDLAMELRREERKRQELELQLAQNYEIAKNNQEIIDRLEQDTRELVKEAKEKNMREEEKMRIERDEKYIEKIKTTLLISVFAFIGGLFYHYYSSWASYLDKCIPEYFSFNIPSLSMWKGIKYNEFLIPKYNCEFKRYGIYALLAFSVIYTLISPGLLYIIIGTFVGLFVSYILLDKYRLSVIAAILFILTSVHWTFLYQFRNSCLKYNNYIYL